MADAQPSSSSFDHNEDNAADTESSDRRPVLLNEPDFECNTNALNGYTIHEIYSVDFDGQPLGEGGFGTVFQGLHLWEPETPVAIKKVDFRIAHRQSNNNRKIPIQALIRRVQETITEVAILQQLRHAYPVVHMHELFVSTEASTDITSLYIVTEFLPGGELFYCIKERIQQQQQQQTENGSSSGPRQPFNEGTVRDIFRVLLEAVAFLHERRVIHRDLKPTNLLLQERNTPTSLKIADFGQSRSLPVGETARTICGTLGYRPPEMFLRKAYTESVDLFSSGCILFFLLAGYQPFSCYPKPRIPQKTIRCEYKTNVESWQRVSPLAKSLVKGLLEEASRRITIGEALNHEWMQDDGDVDYLQVDLTENAKAMVVSLEQEKSVERHEAPIAAVTVVAEPFDEESPNPVSPPSAMHESTNTSSSQPQQEPPQQQRPSPPTPVPTVPDESSEYSEEEVIESSGGCCCFGSETNVIRRRKKRTNNAGVSVSDTAVSPIGQDVPSVAQADPSPPPVAGAQYLHATASEEDLSATHVSGTFTNSFNLDEPSIAHVGTDIPENASLLIEYIRQNVDAASYTELVARSFVRMAVKATARLHALNVVHRNISVDNLVVSGGNKVILKDMQFATNFTPGEQSLTGYCGTQYRITAPEVYNEFSYDEKVDMWSLGFVAYYLLCGVDPFHGTGNTPEVRRLSMKLTFPMGLNLVLSDDAQDFVGRLLRPEPEDRMSAQQALQHEWLYHDDPDLKMRSLELAYCGFEDWQSL